MTPEERQLLTGLFDRIRGQANAPRDPEAETYIGDAVRAASYAPYLLAQAVIVQDHALQAASERLRSLESRIQELEASASRGQAGGSFLGNLGRSLFGEPQQASPMTPAPSVPPSGPWGQGAAPHVQPPSYAPAPSPAWGPPPPSSGSWGAGAPPAPAGGGFLQGALGAAAGVAGGVLLADSIRGLFSGGGGNPNGLASGLGGSMAPGFGGGETIVNNYYDSPPDQRQVDSAQNADYPIDDGSNALDPGESADWSDSGGDIGGGDDFNV